jgi:hypothetical protein
MCFKCHGGTSEENGVKALKDIKSSEFYKWNSTSIGHLLIFLSGSNGEKVHDLARNVLIEYFGWYKGKTNGLWELWKNPNKQLFAMPTCKQLDFMITDTEKFYQENMELCNDEIFNKYQEYIANNEKYRFEK